MSLDTARRKDAAIYKSDIPLVRRIFIIDSHGKEKDPWWDPERGPNNREKKLAANSIMLTQLSTQMRRSWPTRISRSLRVRALISPQSS